MLRAPATTRPGPGIPPGTAPVVQAAFTGVPVPGRVVCLDPGEDGSPTWLRISAEPLVSPAGDVEAVVMTLVDITGLRAAGDALQRTPRRSCRNWWTPCPTPTCTSTPPTQSGASSARAPLTYGVPRAFTAEGVGEPLWASLSEDAAGKLRQATALARATGKPVTAEIATATPAAILVAR